MYVITDFDIENRRRRIAIEIELMVLEAVLKSPEKINARSIETALRSENDADLPF